VNLHWRALGSGDPVTVIVPGLGSTSGEARLPASGLPGTRIVVTLPGHGEAPGAEPGYWSYEHIAAEVSTLVSASGARAAIGTSLGVGVISRLLCADPRRFDSVALLLPAELDHVRESPFGGFVEAARSGDLDRLAELVAEQLPPGVDVGGYVGARTATLARLADAMEAIPGQIPVPHPELLAEVTADVLVIGATRDPLHPEYAARAVAAALSRENDKRVRLEILDSAVPMLTHRSLIRTLLRELISPL
jgi:pimeloyl-ACP methyl ester carboxylesterase